MGWLLATLAPLISHTYSLAASKEYDHTYIDTKWGGCVQPDSAPSVLTGVWDLRTTLCMCEFVSVSYLDHSLTVYQKLDLCIKIETQYLNHKIYWNMQSKLITVNGTVRAANYLWMQAIFAFYILCTTQECKECMVAVWRKGKSSVKGVGLWD